MDLEKTTEPSLMKDMSTGALINVDKGKLAAYRKQKKAMQEAFSITERLDRIENKINRIIEFLEKG